MSQQRPITSYFKIKGEIKPTVNLNNKPKPIRLSLKRNKSLPISPSKSPKRDAQVVEVITVESSDDEKDFIVAETPLSTTFDGSISVENASPGSFTKQSSNLSTSTIKVYSPNKKRMITVRKFPTVRRNIMSEFSNFNNNDVCVDPGNENRLPVARYDKTKYFSQMVSNLVSDSELLLLLGEEYKRMLLNINGLSQPGPTLVNRLYWRRKTWYRQNKLLDIITNNLNQNASCDGINMDAVFQDLVNYGFLEKGDNLNMTTIEDFTEHLLRLEDIKAICNFFKIKKASKRNGIAEIKKFVRTTINVHSSFLGKPQNNMAHVLNVMRNQIGPCYRLTAKARNLLHRLYILSFIGVSYDHIRDKSLEHLIDFERRKLETFPVSENMQIDNATVVFRNNEEFEEYVDAVELYEQFILNTDQNYRCKIVQEVFKSYKALTDKQILRYGNLPTWLRRYTPAYKYVKILQEGIMALKNSKRSAHYTIGVEIYTSLIDQELFDVHKKANWYDEKSLLLHKYLKKPDEAAKELINGFVMDIPEKYKDHLRPRALYIAKLKNISIVHCVRQLLTEYGQRANTMENTIKSTTVANLPIENKKKGKSKYMIYNKDGTMEELCVEDCAMRWYADNTTYNQGGHWEGKIIVTIFYLLFWDIIFQPVSTARGIFLSKYQSYPLDLFTPDFYKNRRDEIIKRLNYLTSSSIDSVVKKMKLVWDTRPTTELSGISRDIGWYNCEQVTLCLGVRAVRVLCERLATDYRYSHSGFPDLTLYDTTNRKVKFVEVKSDNDKPSMKQIQWMHHLKSYNIDTEFCYVGAKTGSAKSRRPNIALSQK